MVKFRLSSCMPFLRQSLTEFCGSSVNGSQESKEIEKKKFCFCVAAAVLRARLYTLYLRLRAATTAAPLCSMTSGALETARAASSPEWDSESANE